LPQESQLLGRVGVANPHRRLRPLVRRFAGRDPSGAGPAVQGAGL